MKNKVLCHYGWDKLDAQGKAEVLKLTEWLNEKKEIEDKFKNKPTAMLCRGCVQKTRYAGSDYSHYRENGDCEICGEAETVVGVASGWRLK